MIFIASLMMLGTRPVGFQPIGDPGYFYLNVEGPPGATRAQMETAIGDATRMLLRQADVEKVFAQVGSGSGSGSGNDLRDGTISVILKDHRALKTAQVRDRVRQGLREIPDVRITTLGGFGSADVEIVLSSQDSAALDRVQLQLQREMRQLKVISDVRPSPPPAGPELVIRPKAEEAARLGVTSQALASVVRIATIGDIDANVAKFSSGERRIPIPRASTGKCAHGSCDSRRAPGPHARRQVHALVLGGRLVVPRRAPPRSCAMAASAGRRFRADLKPGQSLGTTLAKIAKLPRPATPAAFGHPRPASATQRRSKKWSPASLAPSSPA